VDKKLSYIKMLWSIRRNHPRVVFPPYNGLDSAPRFPYNKLVPKTGVKNPLFEIFQEVTYNLGFQDALPYEGGA
jgi:hypothetical protein